jgi:hypothetical protein
MTEDTFAIHASGILSVLSAPILILHEKVPAMTVALG